jgi:hypothetical protein
MAISKTGSWFQDGARFQDGTLQTTAAFGVYNPSTTYAIDASVSLVTSGVTTYWVAVQVNSNSVPSASNTNWQQLSVGSGGGGGGSSFLGAWSSSVAYVIGNEVIYLGGTYVAIAASGPTATTPDLNPTAFTLLAGNAIEIQGIPVNATPPTHNGELLIYDSVTNTYIPGDPLVQGLLPEGSTTTGLNPVLISGEGINGNQYNIAVDNTGHIILGPPQEEEGNPPGIVAIGTSSTAVLAANPLRKGLNLVNMSFETISLAFGNAAVLYSGINLGPGGTFWMDAYDFTTNTINAISTNIAEGGYLGVQEYQ